MQDAASFVARFFAQVPQSTIGFVDEDQGIQICHNPIVTETIHMPKLIHTNNPTGLLHRLQRTRIIASCETFAPAPGFANSRVFA